MRPDWEQDYVEFVSARLRQWHRQAYLLTGDNHRAEDLVQNACTSMYIHWRKVRAAENMTAYARAVLVKAFLNENRRGWFRRVDLVDVLGDVPIAEGISVAERLVLRAALNQLPPRQRAVLVLRYLCDLSVAETAEALGCSEGTVKSQAFHGLTTLRRVLAVPTPREQHHG